MSKTMISTFPNILDKLESPSIVEPKYLVECMKAEKLCSEVFPEAMILCYSGSLLKWIMANHPHKNLEMIWRKAISLDETNGGVGVIGGFGIGAPTAATALEELIACGTKRFISIGNAGALQHGRLNGDIIVCDRAIRDEGTSYHYLPPQKYAYPCPSLTKKVEETLKRQGIPYRVGATWTTDAPYRETISEVKTYQADGVETVEMEASALFAVAEYRKVSIASFFSISDTLADLEWKQHFSSAKTAEGKEKLYRAALAALMEGAS